MTLSDPNKILNLKITQFPQHLLIPSEKNIIEFQVTNYSNKSEEFHIQLQGENLDIGMAEELRNAIRFNSGETKLFKVNLNPTADGYGKFILNINYMKKITQIVKVQKLRSIVPESKILAIFNKIPTFSPESIELFELQDYISTLSPTEIQSFEQKLEQKKTKFKSFQLLKQTQSPHLSQPQTEPSDMVSLEQSFEDSIGALDSALDKSVPGITLDDIEEDIKKLAIAYLSNKNPQKALELALELSDDSEKSVFYNSLIRAYAISDLEATLALIQNISDPNIKKNLIKKIALDRVESDPEQAGRIAMLIDVPAIKEKLMSDIIIKTIEKNSSIALKLSYLLEDDMEKVNILFNISKKLHEFNNQSELIEVINQIINLLLNSAKFDLKENSFNSPPFEALVHGLTILAEIVNPSAAEQIIMKLEDAELKEKLAMDLFNSIYEMVEDVKVKYEPTNIISQYYMFNMYISNINNEIVDFSVIGGNISSNVLAGNFDFNFLFISLFGFNFSIFPIIDRVYSDLKLNSNQSIAYYIYPSNNAHDDMELLIIKSTLKHFFYNISTTSNQLYIFNLDFIPYLGKPSIIFGSNPEIHSLLSSKIESSLGDKVNLIIDDQFFQGGSTLDTLREVFPSNKGKIINLVLSYEFINDYNILKAFIQALF
ncbi:MAG: hypothetical protein ACTSR8_20475 [Promethearchaeota archaeon]